jgi:hypothetical protein
VQNQRTAQLCARLIAVNTDADECIDKHGRIYDCHRMRFSV